MFKWEVSIGCNVSLYSYHGHELVYDNQDYKHTTHKPMHNSVNAHNLQEGYKCDVSYKLSKPLFHVNGMILLKVDRFNK